MRDELEGLQVSSSGVKGVSLLVTVSHACEGLTPPSGEKAVQGLRLIASSSQEFATQ